MDRTQYFKNGYYCGKIEEIFFDKSSLEENIKIIRESFDQKDPDIWKYNNAILTNQNMPSVIGIDEIPTRREFLKKEKLSVAQQLFIAIVPNKVNKFFQNNITDFIKSLYPLEQNFNYHHNDSLSALADGDYITNHRDGGNPNRLCGIIVYLSNYDDYSKKDGGGELVLNTDIIIPPVRGTFVLLDYTLNNLEHEVKPVKNDFLRLAYINFISKIKKENNE
jgi:Rps23 Pro-64 3,4-dihydroxylase Tpa1-like proline 4-hydroxylase